MRGAVVAAARGLALAGILLLGSCGDGEPLLFLAPDRVDPESTVEQSGTVGEAAGDPPRVRVLDRRGNPAAGAEVEFRVRSGGGSVEQRTVHADESGLASPGQWTLGTQTGENVLVASAAGTGGSLFLAEAAPAAPDTLVAYGNGAIGTVGRVLTSPTGVTVRDRFANPVPGISVRFLVVDGGGVLEEEVTVSDSVGRASSSAWILGTSAGPQKLEAQVDAVAAVTIQVTARAAEPDTVEMVAFSPDSGAVGDTIGPFTVEVRDEFGNPVPNATVQGTSLQGGGATHPGAASTGPDGRVELHWILGPTAGAQRLRIDAPPATRRAFLEAAASPGPPDRILPVEGQGQIAGTGQPVPDPPGARVVDRFSNPLLGLEVGFQVVEGEGTIQGSPATTGPAGIARLTSWTLGPEPGINRVEARHGTLEPATFEAEASQVAGVLAVIEGQGEEAPTNMPVATPPGVRLTAGDGTPIAGETVSFTVVEGGGTVTPAQVVTNSQGVARAAEWVLGSSPGPNRVRASAEDVPSVTISAQALAGLHVYVDAVHLNQGSQTYEGGIPLLAGRGGLLRVFLRANDENGEAPQVRAVFYDGGVQVHSQVINPPGIGIPTEVDPDQASDSWNTFVPAGLVTSNLAIRVHVDESESMEVVDRGALEWPTGGGTQAMDVRTTEPFRSTFVRVHSTDLDTTGDIDATNIDDYMSVTLDLFPIGDHDEIIRPGTYSTDAAPMSGSNQGTGWNALVHEIRDVVRQGDAGSDPSVLERYYHGIVKRTATSGIAGIAYLAESPNSNSLAAVSFDRIGSRAAVVAHEFGHNFGRRHAPCGVSPFDSNYPHPDAMLGSAGYSARTGFIIPAGGSHRDIMSYCSPKWSSDYTYASVLWMRQARPVGAPAAILAAETGGETDDGAWTGLFGDDGAPGAGSAPAQASVGREGEGLLFWGSWSREEGARFNPSLPMWSTEIAGGPPNAELRGYDRSGILLFERPVEGLPLDHAEDPTLRQFGVFVVLGEDDRSALDRVVVRTPEGEAELAVPGTGAAGGPAPAPAPTGIQVEAVSAPTGGGAGAPAAQGWIRVRWNAEAYPMVLLRDGSGGPIIGLGRSGEMVLPAPGSGVLGADLSEGIRTLREAVPTPR